MAAPTKSQVWHVFEEVTHKEDGSGEDGATHQQKKTIRWFVALATRKFSISRVNSELGN